MDNLFQIFKCVLPVDIIHFIIPYTYEPQSNALTDDIQSVYTTKKMVHQLYYNRFVIGREESEPSDKDWLINDLFRFSNQTNPTRNGYIDHFYNLFLRNPFLKTRDEVDKYIMKTNLRDVNIQINIFWGLFTSKERNMFLKETTLGLQ
jgi:hypothetical protein